MFRPRFSLILTAFAPSVLPLCAQQHPEFSGTWKQSNDRCVPRQTGSATITITNHDPELTVDIASVYGSAPRSHAVKRYSTDGKKMMMKDSEGDEIDTSVTWHEQSLVFSTDEHEDGRILHSEEVWTLIEDGAALQRVRKGAKGQMQTLIYVK